MRVIIQEEFYEICDGFRLPIVYCPGCGGGLLGDSNHTIDGNGDVNASVVCPCGFHEFITLENWNKIINSNVSNRLV